MFITSFVAKFICYKCSDFKNDVNNVKTKMVHDESFGQHGPK